MNELRAMIGPLVFTIGGEYPAAAHAVAALYGDSGITPAAHYRLDFRREKGPPFQPLPPPYSGERHLFRVEEEAQGGSLQCESYFMRARLPLTGEAQATVVWRDCPPEHAPLLVHNVLRQWAACLLPGHGIVLLHAGGCVIKGRAVLFMAASGTGKTTATAFCGARFPTLGDDIVALDCHGEFPAALPIAGFNPKAPPTAKISRYPLGLLCRLAQAPVPQLTPLAPPEAVCALISQSPFVNVRPALVEQVFDLLLPRIALLPVHHLALANDPGFIPLLEAALTAKSQ